MKIGMLTPQTSFDSLKHVFGSIDKVMHERHELIFRPPGYMHASQSQQEAMTRDFLAQSDVVMGQMDELMLVVRERLGKSVPYVCFLLGNMPRGAPNFVGRTQYFKTTDVLIGNCTGDLEIVRKFFANAQARLLPFAVDETVFYPRDEAARRALKAKLGFDAQDKILIYCGRLTLEKNLHTLLRIFGALQKLVARLHLVVAGDDYSNPFWEFGVFPLSIKNTLARTVEKLGIPQQRVHFIGHRDSKGLHALYNMADLMMNMTLHHDENFGYAQVEAMACGTPVIGTCWGGLKDTIVDGETGYKISTVVTSAGIKIDWWEAINKTVALLNDCSAHERLRQSCRKAVLEKYSLGVYRQNLERILAECRAASARPSEPLQITPFARQYWYLCALEPGQRAPYWRSSRSYQLYRELITPYTGAAPHHASDKQLAHEQTLCLAAPVQLNGGEQIVINDPIFPFEIAVPASLREAIYAAVKAMQKEPVIAVGRLLRSYLADYPDALGALAWMLDAGLLLRTEAGNGDIAPEEVGAQMSASLFSIQLVDHATDVIVVR